MIPPASSMPMEELDLPALRTALSSRHAIRNDTAHLTIGILSHSLSDSRIYRVYTGIVDTARRYGVNVICYDIGLVDREHTEATTMSRVLSRLICPDALDGLLTMQYWSSRDWFIEFCRDFADMPISIISRNFSGYCGVAVDTYSGGYHLAEHLIQQHGYTRFACIYGRTSNTTHNNRIQSTLDACTAHGIRVREDCLIRFDDWVHSDRPFEDSMYRGQQAVCQLLDERKLVPGQDFEVMVCADEMIAISMIQELKRRGYRIPHHVAVVSQENTVEGAALNPPLTTVGVNWEAMGQQACLSLLQRIIDPALVKHITAPAPLVIRHSCGCHAPEVEQAGWGMHPAQSAPPPVSPATRDTFIATLHAALPEKTGLQQDWIGDFHDAFLADILGLAPVKASESGFLYMLETLITRTDHAQDPLPSIHITFSHLHHDAFSRFGGNPESLCRAESLLQQGQIIISQISEHAQAFRRIEQDRLLSTVQEISQRLMASFDIQTLIRVLGESLPMLGIRRAYLSLYEDPAKPREQARLLLAYDEQGLRALPGEGILFPAIMLAPAGILPRDARWSMVVEPLYFGDEQIGFVLFETSTQDPRIYDLLRSDISNALKGALLMQRVNKRSEDLEQANASLQDSLHALSLFQNRLVQSEKMAAMGELVAGIAHEINNPLGVVVTAASCMEDATRAQIAQLQNNALHKSELVAYMEDASESMHLIQDNLARLSAILQSFKRVSVDQSFEEKRSFLFKPYLNDILLNLRPQLRKTRHHIETHCPDTLSIYSLPGIYYQIFTNLVMNSLLHGFEGIEAGTMRIDVSMEDDTLLIVYRDNGIGMDEATLSQVFEPFFTTKRGQGGTGLGMHIIFNLVTEQLHGTIHCSSQPGQGAHFELRIPHITPPDIPQV